MDTTHKPMSCPRCKGDLAFLEYGSKIGSNGKPAKWPIYAKCKNPDCQTGRKNLGIPEQEELLPYEPLPEIKAGVPTKLFQLPAIRSYEQVYYVVSACIKQCVNTMRSEGWNGTLHLYMHGTDLDKLFLSFPGKVTTDGDNLLLHHPVDDKVPAILIEPKDIKVTRGYRYMTIETLIKEKVVRIEEEVPA